MQLRMTPWNSGYMLKNERTAFEVASFLVGKVSGGSVEKVVKGACSPMLLRRRMENLPRNRGGSELGKPSADLFGQSKTGSIPMELQVLRFP